MVNNPSIAHHFIPVFYLENFTNDNGEFYIYKVKEKRFKKNEALFTPKSHFFKKKGNSFEVLGIQSDHIETDFYSPLDNEIANIFTKIKRGCNEAKYGLTDVEILKLEYFFGHLYWRNPASDEHAKNLLRVKSLKDLGIVPRNNTLKFDGYDLYIKSHPDSYKVIKGILPGSLANNIKDGENRNYMILNYPDVLSGILGDNPVILKQRAHNNYIEDMLVPITKELVYSRNVHEIKFSSISVKILIDMMLLKQAREYVCVTDRMYIEQLEDLYNEDFRNLDELCQTLFYALEKNYDGQ